MKYRIYSCCGDEGNPDFDKPAKSEGVRDTIEDARELVATLAERGRDAWWDEDDDED